jgi:5-methylcytosine-specific restriction endonuclease McrA
MSWMVNVKAMADDVLLAALGQVVDRSRRVDAELVAHLAEVDWRRLYLGRGCSSMFGYCTEVLRMSEGAAYPRIAAARAARRHPVLIEMLADGRLHVSGIARLAPHLTPANRDGVLRRAVHRSKRQIEELVAELAPKADVAAAIRKLPARRAPVAPAAKPTPTPAPAAVERPPVVQPLAPARYKVQFTASEVLKRKLDRLANEMRHQVPEGDLAALIEIAVTEKLAAIEKRRYARTSRPRILSEGSAKREPSPRTRNSLAATGTRPTSRAIPAAVRRAVRERDGDQCTFVATDGRRCSQRGGLEFHHEDPFGKGGPHAVENVRLLCRAHNQHLADRDYGAAHMNRFRGSRAREARVAYGPGRSSSRPGATLPARTPRAYRAGGT